MTDILDYRGDIFSIQELTEKGFKINFLEYANLKYNIQNLDMKKKTLCVLDPTFHIFYLKLDTISKDAPKYTIS